MNERGAQIAAERGQRFHATGIDGHGGIRLVFGAIDGVVRGAVDYDLGMMTAEQGSERVGIGQVRVGSVERDDFTRQDTSQVLAKLAAAHRLHAQAVKLLQMAEIQAETTSACPG